MDIKDSGVGTGLLGESAYTWRLTKGIRSLLQARRSCGRGALSLLGSEEYQMLVCTWFFCSKCTFLGVVHLVWQNKV